MENKKSPDYNQNKGNGNNNENFKGSQGLPPGPMGRRGGPHARLNAQKPKDVKKTLLKLMKYLGKNKLFLIALVVIMLVITFVDILGPRFQQLAIDTISFKDGAFNVNLKALRGYLLTMLIIYLISGVLTYMQGVIAANLSQSTVYSMRNDLFKKIVKIPISYIDGHKHGDIMSRMTNDVENVSNAVAQSITVLISSVLTLIGAFFMMIYYSWILALAAIITIPVTIFVSGALGKLMQKYFIKMQKLLGGLNSNVEEMVVGYKTVVAYGKEEKAIEEFSETADELRKASISSRVWASVMGPIMNFLGNFQYVILAFLGGLIMINGGNMTIGTIQAMLQYSKKFSHPINMIANQYATLLTALAGAERIFEIMDVADEINQGKFDINVNDIKGNIEFKDIHFGYVKKEPVLKGLNLSVKSGEKIAIVGATGSGKTTIVNLLTRFYELNKGEILIDGINITDIKKQDLRKAIAIVLQDTVLFNDTIKTNIKYGNLNATDKEMQNAAEIAMASSFINRLPNKYDTVLSEGGGNLSQGQRQLLSISRAVLQNPKILILDEATSSVDTRTEMKIGQAMINLMKNRTSLIIAHRLSTIRDADKIVVVKNGVIFEMGSHEELLNKKGEYYKLYSKQFSGVET